MRDIDSKLTCWQPYPLRTDSIRPRLKKIPHKIILIYTWFNVPPLTCIMSLKWQKMAVSQAFIIYSRTSSRVSSITLLNQVWAARLKKWESVKLKTNFSRYVYWETTCYVELNSSVDKDDRQSVSSSTSGTRQIVFSDWLPKSV